MATNECKICKDGVLCIEKTLASSREPSKPFISTNWKPSLHDKFWKTNKLFATLFMGIQRLEDTTGLPLAHQAMLEEILECWTMEDDCKNTFYGLDNLPVKLDVLQIFPKPVRDRNIAVVRTAVPAIQRLPKVRIPKKRIVRNVKSVISKY